MHAYIQAAEHSLAGMYKIIHKVLNISYYCTLSHSKMAAVNNRVIYYIQILCAFTLCLIIVMVTYHHTLLW